MAGHLWTGKESFGTCRTSAQQGLLSECCFCNQVCYVCYIKSMINRFNGLKSYRLLFVQNV